MPRGYQANSMAQKMVNYVVEHGPQSTQQLADAFGLGYTLTFNIIKCRRNRPGGVLYVGKQWRKFGTDQLSTSQPVEAKPVSTTVASLRTLPTFREWTGHPNPGPIRPGARDYEQIPSLMAGQRVPHHIVDGQITVQSFGKRKVFTPAS